MKNVFVILQTSIIDTSHKISCSLRLPAVTLTSISFLSDPFSGRARSQLSTLCGKTHSNFYERSPTDFIPYICLYTALFPLNHFLYFITSSFRDFQGFLTDSKLHFLANHVVIPSFRHYSGCSYMNIWMD